MTDIFSALAYGIVGPVLGFTIYLVFACLSAILDEARDGWGWPALTLGVIIGLGICLKGVVKAITIFWLL